MLDAISIASETLLATFAAAFTMFEVVSAASSAPASAALAIAVPAISAPRTAAPFIISSELPVLSTGSSTISASVNKSVSEAASISSAISDGTSSEAMSTLSLLAGNSSPTIFEAW